MKTFFYLTLGFLLIFGGCAKDEDTSEAIIGSLNNLSLGDSAKELLSDGNYKSMVIEVAYVAGFRPSKSALDALKDFLRARTHKPGGISIVEREVPSPSSAPYTISEIGDFEEEHREQYTSDDRIAVFIFFADGKKDDEENGEYILGSAYRNTSMVIFEKTVQQLSERSFVSKGSIEAATLKHEFGHLFGLVDNGSPAQTEHEDSENDAHCNVPGCLMASEVKFAPGMLAMIKKNQQLSTSKIEDHQRIGFDEKCIMDLRANGGK